MLDTSRQSEFLKTSDYQCGFKPKSSTIVCSTMVNETIQYYTKNGGKRVYVLLLDATKAFDIVSFKDLFDLLLDKNVCLKIVQLLYYIYTNQLCHVKWGGKNSASFPISNGVKQGGVISALLFSLYVDALFFAFKEVWSGLSCWVNFIININTGRNQLLEHTLREIELDGSRPTKWIKTTVKYMSKTGIHFG